jgi:Zn-dependent protease
MDDFLLQRLLILVPLWLCLTVHEWAHAWSAFQLGDDTAMRLGRLTLNPLAHVDPVGTFLLPLLGVPFGWARPVPVNPTRFRPQVRMDMGMLLTAAAGPISNVVLAAATLFLINVLHALDVTVAPLFHALLAFTVQLNVILAVFNLLPVWPLDGSRIADALMPERWRPAWDRFCSLGAAPLVALIVVPSFLGISLFGWLLEAVGRLIP